jgi:hypothetical protein
LTTSVYTAGIGIANQNAWSTGAPSPARASEISVPWLPATIAPP